MMQVPVYTYNNNTPILTISPLLLVQSRPKAFQLTVTIPLITKNNSLDVKSFLSQEKVSFMIVLKNIVFERHIDFA